MSYDRECRFPAFDTEHKRRIRRHIESIRLAAFLCDTSYVIHFKEVKSGQRAEEILLVTFGIVVGSVVLDIVIGLPPVKVSRLITAPVFERHNHKVTACHIDLYVSYAADIVQHPIAVIGDIRSFLRIEAANFLAHMVKFGAHIEKLTDYFIGASVIIALAEVYIARNLLAVSLEHCVVAPVFFNKFVSCHSYSPVMRVVFSKSLRYITFISTRNNTSTML